MIKLIAIDLDDTLLNKKKEISSRNVSAINNAVTNNVKIVLATGRPYFRVKPILEKLNLLDDNQVVVTLNGGYICNATNNKTLYENVLNNQDIVKIIEVINNTKLCFNAYCGDNIYTEKLEEKIKELPVYDGINFIFKSNDELKHLNYAHKIIVASSADNITKHKNYIVDKLNDYTVVQSTPNFLEVLPNNTTKGIGLQEIANIFNYSKDEIMAIGDAENDISMLEFAKYKVAMKNANDSVKKIANFITKSCEEDGVAFAIEKVLNIANN